MHHLGVNGPCRSANASINGTAISTGGRGRPGIYVSPLWHPLSTNAGSLIRRGRRCDRHFSKGDIKRVQSCSRALNLLEDLLCDMPYSRSEASRSRQHFCHLAAFEFSKNCVFMPAAALKCILNLLLDSWIFSARKTLSLDANRFWWVLFLPLGFEELCKVVVVILQIILVVWLGSCQNLLNRSVPRKRLSFPLRGPEPCLWICLLRIQQH